MKKLLVIGSGKSSSVLIDYLLEQARKRDWHVRVVDQEVELAQERVGDHPCGAAQRFDAENAAERELLIAEVDLVISLLPAHMHGPVAEACTRLGKHFVSASYVAPEVRALDADAKRADVTILNEMGVDPGIDHMSAMEQLDELRSAGATITAFETFTGGLVAPDYDDNPWSYKFTWNPRNVVLAGQGGVKFKHEGRYKYIPYHRLFGRYELLDVPGWGQFEAYPNRDSLKYRAHYGLEDVDTIYRGTLRRPGFCKAWDALVQLGLTDDTYELENLAGMTFRDFVNSYLWYDPEMSVELKLRAYLKLDYNSHRFDKLTWLGLFDREPIGLERGTPAQVLQKLLEPKFALGPDDKDMIVMLHKVEYELEGKRQRLLTHMVALGDDPVHTAMAKTVGLTAAIGAKAILTGDITSRGCIIPTTPEVYRPLMTELRDNGIRFEDQLEQLPAQ